MSCSQNDDMIETQENNLIVEPLGEEEILMLQGLINQENNQAGRSTNPTPGYTFFASTGNNSNYFPVGAYGVQITRTPLLDPNPIYVWPVVQVDEIDGWCVTSLMRLDKYNNLISSQMNVKIETSGTNVRPFTSTPIEGEEKIVLLFWPKVAGDYKYAY